MICKMHIVILLNHTLRAGPRTNEGISLILGNSSKKVPLTILPAQSRTRSNRDIFGQIGPYQNFRMLVVRSRRANGGAFVYQMPKMKETEEEAIVN